MIIRNVSTVEQKRRGPDILIKVIHWMAASGWILMFAVLLLTDKARPKVAFFLDRILQVPLRTSWDRKLLNIACFLLVLILGLCLIGLFINSWRHKRKTDHYNSSLVIMGILALGGIFIIAFS